MQMTRRLLSAPLRRGRTKTSMRRAAAGRIVRRGPAGGQGAGTRCAQAHIVCRPCGDDARYYAGDGRDENVERAVSILSEAGKGCFYLGLTEKIS